MSRKFAWVDFFLLSIFFADAQDSTITPMDFCFDASYEGRGPINIWDICNCVFLCSCYWMPVFS